MTLAALALAAASLLGCREPPVRRERPPRCRACAGVRVAYPVVLECGACGDAGLGP